MVNHPNVELALAPEEPAPGNRGMFGEYLKSLSSISDAYLRASKCEGALSLIKSIPEMFSNMNEREIAVLYIEAINAITDGWMRTSVMERAIELIAKNSNLQDLIHTGAAPVNDWQTKESRATTSESITSTSSFFDSPFGFLLLLICTVMLIIPLFTISVACAIRLFDWILRSCPWYGCQLSRRPN